MYLETDSGSLMSKPLAKDRDKVARYRERMRAAGADQVLFELPRETIAMLDDMKKSQGLRSRSQVLLQLIERGRIATQQMS